MLVSDEVFEKHKGHRVLKGAVLGNRIFCSDCNEWLPEMLVEATEREKVYGAFAELSFWANLPFKLDELKLALDVMSDEEVRRLKSILKARLSD